jgi:phytol kinase
MQLLSFDTYFQDRYYLQNACATVVTLAACVSLLSFFDFLADKNIVSMNLSRKVVHIFTGPVFLLFWNTFSAQTPLLSKALASSVPLLVTIQFLFVGLGIIKDEKRVKSVSRTGDRRDILKGPLYYGIVFVICTFVYWRHSPAAIIGLSILCGGDGIADIM